MRKSMGVTLREINEENWVECICLSTNKDSTNTIFEEFIASNAVSIAQSKVQKGWTIKAIYRDETMVGFTMYGYSPEYQFYEVARIMIHHKYQNMGFGTRALELVINEMHKEPECEMIFISFDPLNWIAKRLYQKVGFRDSGKKIKGELLYYYKIER